MESERWNKSLIVSDKILPATPCWLLSLQPADHNSRCTYKHRLEPAMNYPRNPGDPKEIKMGIRSLCHKTIITPKTPFLSIIIRPVTCGFRVSAQGYVIAVEGMQSTLLSCFILPTLASVLQQTNSSAGNNSKVFNSIPHAEQN